MRQISNPSATRFRQGVRLCLVIAVGLMMVPQPAQGIEPAARFADGSPPPEIGVRKLIEQAAERLLAGHGNAAARLEFGGRKATVAVARGEGNAASKFRLDTVILQAKVEVAKALILERDTKSGAAAPTEGKATVKAVSVVRLIPEADGKALAVAILSWDDGPEAQLAAGAAMKFRDLDDARHALTTRLAEGTLAPFGGDLLQLEDGTSYLVAFGQGEGEGRGPPAVKTNDALTRAQASLQAYQTGEQIEWRSGSSRESSRSSHLDSGQLASTIRLAEGSVPREGTTDLSWTVIAQEFKPTPASKERQRPAPGQTTPPAQR